MPQGEERASAPWPIAWVAALEPTQPADGRGTKDMGGDSFSEELNRVSPAALPRMIQRAISLIEEHTAEPLTVEDIAEAVGLGVRALQAGFRRHVDATPMGYLREIRLCRVQAELAEADPGSATVTDIAMRWGFVHPGRFAVHYRQRFGESPSTTLRS
ncbi:AraC family transcriptional regulator [Streptomyces sp. ISID311]|nr:AraC family transcriptional regulator [Streptomyces sp. ISID311]